MKKRDVVEYIYLLDEFGCVAYYDFDMIDDETGDIIHLSADEILSVAGDIFDDAKLEVFKQDHML